jgi:hypothetical protein
MRNSYRIMNLFPTGTNDNQELSNAKNKSIYSFKSYKA